MVLAIGAAGIAMKIPMVKIDYAHPENIFFYFYRLHFNLLQKGPAFAGRGRIMFISGWIGA